jgi:hypothetical protein
MHTIAMCVPRQRSCAHKSFAFSGQHLSAKCFLVASRRASDKTSLHAPRYPTRAAHRFPCRTAQQVCDIVLEKLPNPVVMEENLAAPAFAGAARFAEFYFLGLLTGTRSCSVVRGCFSAYFGVTKRPLTELRSTGFVGIVFDIVSL